MNKDERKQRVDTIFNEIIIISQVYKDNIPLREKFKEPLIKELYNITQIQMKNRELDHLH